MKHIPLNLDRRKLLKAMGASLATATFLPACSEADVSKAESPAAVKNLGIVGADGRRILPLEQLVWQPKLPTDAERDASFYRSASNSYKKQ